VNVLGKSEYFVPSELNAGLILLKGASGSGKSSLLREMCGFVGNSAIRFSDERPAYLGSDCGLIEDNLLQEICLLKNVSVEAAKAWWCSEKPEVFFPELTVERVAQIIETPTANLSRGQIQRMVILREIMLGTKTLFLDESLSGVQATLARNLVLHLLDLSRVVVMVDHRDQFDDLSEMIWQL
jgi:ABC-type nitrate/sulfonate/bicarbonate transport system ATPase subunit